MSDTMIVVILLGYVTGIVLGYVGAAVYNFCSWCNGWLYNHHFHRYNPPEWWRRKFWDSARKTEFIPIKLTSSGTVTVESQ